MSDDADRWRRARPVLDAALDAPPGERAALVDRTCGDDQDLRDLVHRLLAAAGDDDGFLGGLQARHLDLLHDPVPDAAGTRVGAFRLERLIGTGGMGAVYLAERVDGEFSQQVAVKLMRAGPLGGDGVARFRRERQILARLGHPGIARLLDGGVTATGPYLVMEYVEGQPIDQACDTTIRDVAARVRLGLAVCNAVDYAHRSMVLHRDLKPGNIHVTATGEVKLLDFGIARLLDEGALGPDVTATGGAPFTPEYASPEQVRGEPLTTASDVYSLGCVLYRMLTGRLPHDLAGLSPSAIERRVTEEAPARPGALQRDLRGDLETVLLKAIHRDPARRYQSVSALADDLQRVLDRRPVSARPDTLAYRVTSFARRHAVGVGATAVIALAIAGGAYTTMAEGRRAERRFGEVRGLANALLFDLHDAVRDLPGATAVRQKLVSRALMYLDVLRGEAPADPALQLELASAYEQIGEIQGDPHRANLGDLAGALSSYRQAFNLRTLVWAGDTNDAAVRLALADSYGRLAVVTSWSGKNGDAIDLSARGLELLEPLGRSVPPPARVQAVRGRVESELGWWLIWAGRIEDGMRHLDRGVADLEHIATTDTAGADLHIDLWRAYTYQLDGYRFSNRFQAGLDLMEARGLPLLDALLDRFPHHPGVLYAMHTGYDFIGLLNGALRRPRAAAEGYRKALAFAEEMVRSDSANQKAFEALARANATLADVLLKDGKVAEAVSQQQLAIGVYDTLFRRNPQNAEFANMLGNAQRRLCIVLVGADRAGEALPHCEAGESTLEQAVAVHADNVVVRANLGSAYLNTARAYRQLARGASGDSSGTLRQSSRERYERGLTIFTELTERSDATPEIRPESIRAEIAALDRGG